MAKAIGYDGAFSTTLKRGASTGKTPTPCGLRPRPTFANGRQMWATRESEFTRRPSKESGEFDLRGSSRKEMALPKQTDLDRAIRILPSLLYA